MRVVITGSSSGMGLAAANKFLDAGHEVHGIDIKDSKINRPSYYHHIADVSDKSTLPNISGVNILINNAGVQNSGNDIQINLVGLINCTEAYGLQPDILSILNQASVSAHNGAEFGEYSASKGGVLAYTKWTAKQVAEYGATCNSLSFGGVLTELNQHIINDTKLWDEVMDLTPLRKWVSTEEAADWIYFITIVNHSCSGQDIIIDNMETLNHKFIW